MSERHGAVWWTELATRDVEKAVAYYGEVCGWQFEAMPQDWGAYHVGRHDGQPVIGIIDLADMPGADQVPPHWLSYFAVADLDSAIARTKEMGGELLRPAFDVPGVGRIAVLKDPTGAAMALITPADTEAMPA